MNIAEEAPVATRSRWVPLVLPIALLVALAALLTVGNPAAWLNSGAPAAEEVVFERVELSDGVIVAHVRNAVGAPVTIAQVSIDDAFWAFTADPGTTLGPLAAATLTMEYPWVAGETHVIKIHTASGLAWEHTIDVAVATPTPGPASLGTYALIGLLVGFLPVAAGMAFYPALRAAPLRWTGALLAFTLGLLAFLATDTVGEGLELAGEVAGAFHGLGLFFGAALFAVLGVLMLERILDRRNAPAWTLALLIAIGIGLHNLGEGLVIGSAFALGSLALGNALIVGFAVHNVTEGPAVIAPMMKSRRGLTIARFLLLAAIAGLPTVLGAWLGAFASNGLLPVIFFGLGAGAILVVIVQVGGAMRRDGPLLTPLYMGAFALGYAVMLATGLLTA